MKAIAFDLDIDTKTFKIAYKKELFETGNLSGLLAGVVGNIDGMKMLKKRMKRKKCCSVMLLPVLCWHQQVP